MCKLIGFGGWSSYYYYILISTVTKFLKEDILGLSVDYSILPDLKITHHPIIILLLGFISDSSISFIILLILHFKNKKKEENNDNVITSTGKNFQLMENRASNALNINEAIHEKENYRNNSFNEEIPNKYYLIHNDRGSMEIESITKNAFKFAFISCFLITIKDFMTYILYNSNDIFDYYFLNLIIVSLILRFYFKEKMYKHQLLAIILVSMISTACFISCIFVTDTENNKGKNSITSNFSLIFKYPPYIIIILVLVYFCISGMFCSGIIIQKNVMQFKFFSFHKILLWKGVIGICFCVIGLAISSNVTCDGNIKNNIRDFCNQIRNKTNFNGTDDIYDFSDVFVCNNYYKGNRYFDNFFSYFEHLPITYDEIRNHIKKNETNDSTLEERKKELIIEVSILFGYFILHYVSELSLILVNKFLSPIHYLITESFFNIIHLPYEIGTKIRLLEYIEYNKNFKCEIDFGKIYNIFSKNETSRYLKLTAIIIEILGYLIYMEIIHLNFCGLNRNIKKNIEKRAKIDSQTEKNVHNIDFNINDVDESLD
jgi:hypothetical protein